MVRRGSGGGSKNGSGVAISLTIALLVYFALRGTVTSQTGYDNTSAYAVFFETLLPIGIVVADLWVLFRPMMR